RAGYPDLRLAKRPGPRRPRALPGRPHNRRFDVGLRWRPERCFSRMATNPLVKKFDLSQDDMDRMLCNAMGSVQPAEMGEVYTQSVKNFEADSILRGRIVNIVNSDVIVDI